MTGIRSRYLVVHEDFSTEKQYLYTYFNLSFSYHGLFTGRLGFSKVDGLDSSGKFEKLYFFGARGFSIFRASDIALVYDSGDEVAKIIAKFYPDVFSTDTNTDDPANETPEDLFDKRSDNQVEFLSPFRPNEFSLFL